MAGPGKYRRKTRPEAEERLTYTQDNWAGMNKDHPATEIEAAQLTHLENTKSRGKYIQSRTGSKLFSATFLPGSGRENAIWEHPTAKRWILHRGVELYLSTDVNAFVWEQIADSASVNLALPDSFSTIRQYDDDAIIFTTNGIYHLDLTNNIAFKINHPSPENRPASQGAGDYTYRYLITFLRLVDSTGTAVTGTRDRFDSNAFIIGESGTTRVYGITSPDFAEHSHSSALSKDNTTAFNLTTSDSIAAVDSSTDILTLSTTATAEAFITGAIITFTTSTTLPNPLQVGVDYYVIKIGTAKQFKVATSLANALVGTNIDLIDTGSGAATNHTATIAANKNAPTGVTHYGIYRTLNINSATDDGFDPITSEGNNSELYSWVADVLIADTTFTDKTDDNTLRAQIAIGSRLAKMRGFVAVPDGNVGYITGSWLFAVNRGDTTLHYSSISETQKRFAGFYAADFQFHRFDQKIQQLWASGDTLLVLSNNQTKPVTLTSFFNAGRLEFVPILNHFPDGDNTIGVVEWATIAEVEKSTIMARTSDHAIRIWNGVEWGPDLSSDLVNDIFKTMMPGSVASYFGGSFYLWYRDDSTNLFNNKCIRLDLPRSQGTGWSLVTGTWIFPPLYTGAVIIQDENDLQRLIVLDNATKRLFWIDTFDGFTGSSLTASFGDKITDEGICALGAKFFYDEMDNNSLDRLANNVEGTTLIDAKDSSPNSGVTEINGRLELFAPTGSDASAYARLILNKYIHNGDFETSVRQTFQDIPSQDPPTFNYDWEVKVANFSVNWVAPNGAGNHYASDQGQVNDLNNGFLAYVNRTPGNPNEGASTLNWKYRSGSSEETGSIAWGTISNPILEAPHKLGIKRTDNTISVFVNDQEVLPARSTNTLWGSITNLRSSFSAEKGNAETSKSGFNSFFVSGGDTPNDCVGIDGQGSTTVTSVHNIASIIRFRELIGREESHNVRHEESHTYFRPLSETDGFHSTFKVDWKSYSDGNETAIETVKNIAYKGDVQNWSKVEGARIQHELNMNMGLWKLVNADIHYVSQDKKDVLNEPGSTDEGSYQDLLAGTSGGVNYLKHWLTRPDINLNRATGTDYTLNSSAAVAFVTGPDGEEYGINFSFTENEGGAVYTQADTTLYSDFSILFWFQNRTDSNPVIQMTTTGSGPTSVFWIAFTTDTNLRIFDGTKTVNIAIDTIASGWHSFFISKTGETITVYQNGSTTAKGSDTIRNILGGSTMDIKVRSEVSDLGDGYDIRIYSKDIITTAAYEYYYDQIVNNSGSKVLPSI